MKLEMLDDNVSVSDQIHLEDLPELAKLGVELVICNRPNDESEHQPLYEDLAIELQSLGITAKHIPFSGGQMNQQHVDALAAVEGKYKRIHLYCRTGNRSSKLWQALLGGREGASSIVNDVINEKVVNDNVTGVPFYDVVIVGAGSGGIAAAASLKKRKAALRVVLIDPAKEHYYQPGWTMVGGGVFNASSTQRNMASLIPNDVTWIQKSVSAFEPKDNNVILSDGSRIAYSQLVVSSGLTLNWGGVEGLEGALGKNGVTSNYRYDLAPYTWKLVQEMKSGVALFTQPPMPIKCAGAPQKALYLSASHWHKNGLINNIDVQFYNAGGVLFGVPDYVPALQSYIDKYQADVHYMHNLSKIDGEAKTAWFTHTAEDGSTTTTSHEFDMIHVCPPQCAPEFIKASPFSNEQGWFDVDQHSLRQSHHDNVWGIGDVVNTTNAKTMAAARKQAPVVAQNICDVLDGQPPSQAYDGYGSCPLTVEHGKIVLAEFTYGGVVAPTFPQWLNDGTKPTRLAWVLKARMLPMIYWRAMLKGREWLT